MLPFDPYWCIFTIICPLLAGQAQGSAEADQNTHILRSCANSTTLDEACSIQDFSMINVCKGNSASNSAEIRFQSPFAEGISARDVTLVSHPGLSIIDGITIIDNNILNRWTADFALVITNSSFGILRFGVSINSIHCIDERGAIYLRVKSGNVTYKTQPKIWFHVEGCGGESTPSQICQNPGTAKPTDDGQDIHVPMSLTPPSTQKPDENTPTSPKPTSPGETGQHEDKPVAKDMSSSFGDVRVIDIVMVFLISLQILISPIQKFCKFVMERFSSPGAEAASPPIASPESPDPNYTAQDSEDSQSLGVGREVQSVISRPGASENIEESVKSAVSHPSENVSPSTREHRVGAPDAPHSNLNAPADVRITVNPLNDDSDDENQKNECIEESTV